MSHIKTDLMETIPIMQLIKDLDVKPFARIIWASPESKKEWEPKITLARQCYSRLERETVKEGLRKCTTTHVAPSQINEVARNLAKQGLVFLPYKKVGTYSGFAHSHPPVIENKPWNYYGPIATKIEDAELFCASEDKGDHETIAKLLGYPECCSAFFRNVWMAGYIDPVFQSAGGNGTSTEVRTNPSMLFIGLRYIGVRIAPHLPCSVACLESLMIAHQWLDVADQNRIPGKDELLEVLLLPLEWNCYKGIAEVTTKHFKVVTNSNPCSEPYKVIVQ